MPKATMNGVQKIAKIKNKQSKNSNNNKLKQNKTKANLFTIYESLKLRCTCKWSIDLSGFHSTIISILYFVYELFPLRRLKWYPI